MPTISICREYEFAAAHRLPYHQGKCRRPHGHNYVLEVEVSGELKPAGSSAGMVTDFADLDGLVQAIVLDHWDHEDLNQWLDNPTAENLAANAFRRLSEAAHVPLGVEVVRVRLWETSRSWAEVKA